MFRSEYGSAEAAVLGRGVVLGGLRAVQEHMLKNLLTTPQVHIAVSAIHFVYQQADVVHLFKVVDIEDAKVM